MSRWEMLLIAGIAAITVGIALMALSGAASGAVIIFVGPVPIAVGWGKFGVMLLMVSILIAIAMILLTYLMLKGMIRYGQTIR